MDIIPYFMEKGQGMPLFLLHGNGEDSSYFEGQIEEFSKYFHVIAPDTRGHGKTDRGTKPLTLFQCALDLKDFFMEKSIQKAHILGFSDGGNIALQFAMLFPEAVSKLILNGANTDVSGLHSSVRISVLRKYKAFNSKKVLSPKEQKEKELLALMATEPHFKEEDLAAVCSKTLVLVGNRDMILRNHSEKLASLLKNGHLQVISGNHFIARSQTKAYNDAVLSFLLHE